MGGPQSSILSYRVDTPGEAAVYLVRSLHMTGWRDPGLNRGQSRGLTLLYLMIVGTSSLLS